MKQKQEKKRRYNVFKTYFRLRPELYRAAPWKFAFYDATDILHGLSWGLLALFQQRLFDAAAGCVGSGGLTTGFVWAFAVFILSQVACQVLNGVANYLFTPRTRALNHALRRRMHAKIDRMDPVVFEDNEKLDLINKATEGLQNSIWFVDIINMIFLFYLPYFVSMGIYMFTLKPVFIASIALVFVPTALSQIMRTKFFSELEDESAPVRRECEYYEKCIADREYFRETRSLGAFGWFRRQFADTLRLLNRLRMRTNVRSTALNLGARLMTIAGYFGILIMLLNALLSGEISVGAFAAVFTNIQTMFSLMEEIVCRHIGSAMESLGSVANYIEFIDLPERGGAQVEIPDGDIVLENVSFTYPGAERKAIDRVSFTIRCGETLAVVGENGAGKSTFTRLVIGMYTPQEGRVTRGGIDLRTADMASLRKGVSAVFQKFRRYKLTLRENLALAAGDMDCDQETLSHACQLAELDENAEAFPKGLNTMLTREYDAEAEADEESADRGVDLSGGQWQRVATARAYCRDHRLILLDEPTAAIDPLEESRTYDRFARLAGDRTAIIVTHRLGSVRLADRILVLKDGKVAEVGTHDELMNANGVYARMFEAQRQWYV